MRTTAIEKDTEGEASALKVRTLSLLVLELYSSDLVKIDRQLLEKEQRGPDFFRSTPLLLDLKYIDDDVDIDWLKRVCEMMVTHCFIPVGITGASTFLENAARREEIAVWSSKKADQSESAVQPVTAKKEEGKATKKISRGNSITKIIDQPVRSGQRVYAENGDLIVLSSVSTGAEIMADGHIHVYGSLRGRALAGAKGWEGARIFCSDLKADLVSIAGYYTINDDLPDEQRNSGVKISLKMESLHIEPLNP